MLSRLKSTEVEIRLITKFIDAYLPLNESEIKTYQMEFDRLNPAAQESILDLETSWERKGRLKGRAEGRIEGRVELLCRLLRRKFGHVESELIIQLGQLSAPQLDGLAEELLDVTTLKEVENFITKLRATSETPPS